MTAESPRKRLKKNKQEKAPKNAVFLGMDRLLKRVLVELGSWNAFAPLCDDIRALRAQAEPYVNALLKETEDTDPTAQTLDDFFSN